MKAFLTILLVFSTNAWAGLDITVLEDMSLTLLDRQNKQVEACAYDINNKRRCEVLGGFLLKDTDFKGSYSYQIFDIDDEGVYSKDTDFAKINIDNTLEISDDIICELEWYSYRYTLEERLQAFSLGVIVRNRDDLSIKCESKN